MIRSLIILAFLASPALADDPQIKSVKAEKTGSTWRFDVTVLHPDTGWDHYADGWQIQDMQGNELGLRVLVHPHVNEQPFTRSLSGVVIPDGVTKVQVVARCLVDGWASKPKTVSLK